MANALTGLRILCAILLFCTSAFSPGFYALYLFAGLTDMVDGTVARITNTANEFGARLDTLADMVFVLACLAKLLPVLTMPTWLCIWIGLIALLKGFNILLEYLLRRRLAAKHTFLNKVTGFLLFLFPLTCPFLNLPYSGSLICAIALLAALQEGYMIWLDA